MLLALLAATITVAPYELVSVSVSVTHTPFIAKQPKLISIPCAKVLVAVEDALICPFDPMVKSPAPVLLAIENKFADCPPVPCIDRLAAGVVVPIPRYPVLLRVRTSLLLLLYEKIFPVPRWVLLANAIELLP